ncbi:MAG: alpha-2-macroglobulin family protein, partial [Bacteroidales bacterium]|nr:alpha-2-macroglobulin family protein [Bacteroidales bacterium]
TLYGEKNKSLPVKELAWFHLNKKEALPGDTVMFFVGSAVKANRVLIEITSGNEVFYSKWHNVSNKKLAIPFIVKEEQRGTLTFQAVFVKHNRLLKSAFDLDVPFTNKMLDISLETKREKLSPGAEETWTFKVSGKNSEKVAAELLASMYDASLDQFREHSWSFNPIDRKPGSARWMSDNGFLSYSTSRLTRYQQTDYHVHPLPEIQLNWFGLQPFNRFGYTDKLRSTMMAKSAHVHEGEVGLFSVVQDNAAGQIAESMEADEEQSVKEPAPQATMLRSDFRETAFFFPQLNTDANGNLSFSFRLPDALTRWRLMLLAHSKDLKTGSNTYNFTASKDLMIVPNQPRFYRERDTAFLAAKIVNTSTETLSGIARLEISDPFSSKALSYFVNNQAQRPFINLKPGQSQELKWHIAVDGKVSILALRFSVSSGLFTDSEEQLVPVLPMGVLVTETMPMQLAGNSNKTFVFKSLQEQGPKEKNQRLNLQFSNNPAWYAIQALPYIHETGQEHSDNIFYRYYANTLASYVANSIPGVMKVMESWRQAGSDALLSNLEKNEALKSVILAETPWVIDAADETQQKKNIALLFDLNRMRYEQEQAIKKLQEAQLPDGSWAWFPGMPGNRHITLNIVTGMGKLRQMVPDIGRDRQTGMAIANAIQYLDKENRSDYDKMVKNKSLDTYKISSQHLGYLYARSFFTDLVPDEDTQKVIDFYLSHAAKDWLPLDHGMQAVAAMVLHRSGNADKAKAILASLRERALRDAVLGTYWKRSNTFYFSQTPVESHAMLIAAFDEIDNDIAWIDEMRTYLL